MRVLVLGAMGFIGKNLIKYILDNTKDTILMYDRKEPAEDDFIWKYPQERYEVICQEFNLDVNFISLTWNVDVVYHLISTTLPNTPMNQIAEGITDNVVVTSRLLQACVDNNVQKVIFFSSGGTGYGISNELPLNEDMSTNPISAYGMQKIAIEKLLYLFYYTYGLDYRIIRLSNPYGHFQKANGIQGVITTFVYRALHNEQIEVYGNGETIRDYIYIDDAIKAIMKIVNYKGKYKIFNVGSGTGRSIREVISLIQSVTGKKLHISYLPKRKADVPANVLDISRYEQEIGVLVLTSLEDGIKIMVSEFT